MNPRIQNLLGSTIIALAATSAQAADITIMPVGDSITRGFSGQQSFREELDARLAASGCTFISRGPVTGFGYQGAGGHAGYSGHRADHFINGLGNPNNPNPDLFNPGIGPLLDDDFAANGGYPEVVLLNVGTNDIVRGIENGDTLTQTVNTTLSDIAQLISTIHGKDPNIEIFLGNLVPLYADDADGDGDLDDPGALVENHPFANALSDALESAYLNTTVPGVHLVDLRTGYRSTDMVSDGVHPSPDDAATQESDSGEHRLAVAIAAALEEKGLCVPTGTDNSFPLTDILTPTSINGDTFTGPISFTGRAIDTGGAGFTSDGAGPAPRVKIAIQDNATNLYFDIANNSGFGGFVSIDASLTNPSANYVDWSTPSVTLPDGDYTLFALAIDDDGQQNFFGSGNDWPERLQFIIQGNGSGGGGGGGGGGALFQEAESGTLFGGMTITSDAGVSNGQFVEVPGAGAVNDPSSNFVEFSVTIPTAGEYQINAGVRGPSGSQNSFIAQIDNGTQYEWHIPSNNQLIEDLVSDGTNPSNGIDVTENLSAGTHTLRVFGREAGAQLDWIEFELVNNNSGGGALLQEAESGTFFGDMTITNDSSVSNGQFVEVPGTGAVSNPFTHYVEYSVSIATAGEYQINAGVRGPASNQNSFFAQIDSGTQYEWHIPPNNQLIEDLISNRVSGNDVDISEFLSAGVHTLRVFGREAGAQLDWIEFELLGGSTADTTDPTGEATNPADGSTISPDNDFTISGEAIDSSGIASVIIRVERRDVSPIEYWNGTIWQTESIFLDATNIDSNGDWDLEGVDLSEPGSYRVRLSITDNAGNTAASNQNPRTNFEVVSSDNTDPTGEATNPADDSTISPDNDFTISGEAIDPSGIASVIVRVERRDVSPIEYWNGTIWQTSSIFLDATNIASNGDWDLEGVDLSEPGSYRVRLSITDNVGNTAASNQNPRTNFTVGP